MGRLLITLFLIERSRLSQPLLYLSDFIERHKSDSLDLLQRFRAHGEWIPWTRYSLSGVETTAKDAATRARQLLDLRESLLRETKGTKALVDQLSTNPYITIATATNVLGVATRLVRELEAKGLLRVTTGKSWGKVYVPSCVLASLERRSTN